MRMDATCCFANWREPFGSRKALRSASLILTPPALPSVAPLSPRAMSRPFPLPMAIPKTTGLM
jgi:hypothetical protein